MLTRLALALFLCLAANLAAGADVPADAVRVELLPGWRMADGRHMAGLRLRLGPGWKTYWRRPGETGVPPRFSFARSSNFAGFRVHWPAPQVFERAGGRSIGYGGSVVLPLEVRPRDAAAPVQLAGEVQIGVCKDICVPMTIDIRATLPASARRRVPAIGHALRRAPVDAATAGVSAVRCRLEPSAESLHLVAAITMPPLGDRETAVIESRTPGTWLAPTVTRRDGATLLASAELMPESGSAIDRSALRITVLADGRAVEIEGCRG